MRSRPTRTSLRGTSCGSCSSRCGATSTSTLPTDSSTSARCTREYNAPLPWQYSLDAAFRNAKKIVCVSLSVPLHSKTWFSTADSIHVSYRFMIGMKWSFSCAQWLCHAAIVSFLPIFTSHMNALMLTPTHVFLVIHRAATCTSFTTAMPTLSRSPG